MSCSRSESLETASGEASSLFGLAVHSKWLSHVLAAHRGDCGWARFEGGLNLLADTWRPLSSVCTRELGEEIFISRQPLPWWGSGRVPLGASDGFSNLASLLRMPREPSEARRLSGWRLDGNLAKVFELGVLAGRRSCDRLRAGRLPGVDEMLSSTAGETFEDPRGDVLDLRSSCIMSRCARRIRRSPSGNHFVYGVCDACVSKRVPRSATALDCTYGATGSCDRTGFSGRVAIW